MLTPRHPLRSCFSPLWLHRRRLRCARICALLTGLAAALLALLLHGVPQPAAWNSAGEEGVFCGIPYTAAEDSAPSENSAHPAPRPIALAPAPPSTPPTLLTAAELPEPTLLPEQELVAEQPLLTMAEEDSWEASTPPAPAAERPRPAAAPRRTALATAEAPSPPAYREAPKPPYPPALRARRISGSVGVRIAVSAEGLPTEVTITAPSGHTEFDSTVRQWILTHWRFHPAQADGTPIAAHVQTRVDFRPF